MNLETRTDTLIPLSWFSVDSASDRTTRAGFRRFGTVEADLAIDFSTPNRATLVTKLLEVCTVDPDGALPDGFFRELSIVNRIECLLILAAGRLDAPLSLVFKCAGCGEDLEFELSVAELSELQREADLIETVGVRFKGRPIEFRKPRGRDQEAWAGMVFRDQRDAAAGMIGTLAVTPGLPENIKASIHTSVEEALDEADPLVNFTCSVSCGECGEPHEYPVDLTETALGLLDRTQRQLVYTVHRLASHYHWSEREIFVVPDWRRQEYLKHIGATRK